MVQTGGVCFLPGRGREGLLCRDGPLPHVQAVPGGPSGPEEGLLCPDGEEDPSTESQCVQRCGPGQVCIVPGPFLKASFNNIKSEMYGPTCDQCL